ncbi:hypothetical protein ER308_09690 [Egibacter rhizosphaerae]|uniref:PNPLA domain-containing protein n=1 Tax=Egibacter rhizosphaerae TaxID=1670831 RepID=A0A411YF08_9ACTN|nr:patatin-like phospholipase family protein [Egibacter rhizosphaerae]QBI19800.1 hypothetical protein ER308_09690 [Egibacter rhizosphaerae]
MSDEQWYADLVLEGGGVKGTALVGAIEALTAEGYAFPRVAGTSAGAIVGALTAADMPTSEMRTVLGELDYRRFTDTGLLGRVPLLGPLVGILRHGGIYRGEELVTWLEALLAEHGVTTFGDLRVDDPGSDLPTYLRYRLVVVAADVSRGRLVRLPWDYQEHFGLDPDRQRVVDAVRASMAIPFFFRAAKVRHHGTAGASTLVDGGLLSNFPVGLFDRTDGLRPRWPTFGVKLSEREPPGLAVTPVRGPLSLAASLVATMRGAHDARHLDDPGVQDRTMFVDTSGVSTLNFDLSREEAEELRTRGHGAATGFLAGWDHERYIAAHRPDVAEASG